MVKADSSPLSVRFSLLWAIATVLLGFIVAPVYQWRLNPDAFSYVHLAQAFLAGDAVHAVSPYWSPLFGRLLSAFLLTGLPPMLAARVFLLCLAGILVFLGDRVLRRLQVERAMHVAALVCLTIIGLSFAMSVISPDLLFTDLLLGLFLLMTDGRLFRSVPYMLGLGVLAAIAFFAKTVALPFFVVGFAAACLYFASLTDIPRVRIGSVFLLICIIAITLSAPWVYKISALTHRFTLGLSAEVIYASEGPHHEGLPMLTQGLFAPLPGNMSIWDTPELLPRHTWSPWSSLTSGKHQISLVLRNIDDAFGVFSHLSVLSMGILLGLCVFALRSTEPSGRRLIFCIAAAHIVLMTALYLPILIDPRYLWYPHILLLLCGASLFSSLRSLLGGRSWAARVLLLAFVVSFTAAPAQDLLLQMNDGKVFAQQSVSLGQKFSLEQKTVAADSWKTGLFFSYYTKSLYFGRPKNIADASALERELLDHRIDVYTAWGTPPTLRTYRRITDTGITPVLFVRNQR